MSVLTRPDTIVYTITNGAIAWNPESEVVGARVGGKVRFRIDNSHDDVAYDVSIPFKKFELKEPKGTATREPINEAASGGKDAINVPAGSTRELGYVIKPSADFPFEKDKVTTYTYKYTLNYTTTDTTTNTTTNTTTITHVAKTVDPDLEVTP